jgi:hypothetical protein
MRIALYARVSTEDQDTENQLAQLREWCGRAGHEIYVEHESGRKGTDKRRAFGQLFEDASRRRFSIASCSGRWIASAVRAWCRRSCTYSASRPTASPSTATPSHT